MSEEEKAKTLNLLPDGDVIALGWSVFEAMT